MQQSIRMLRTADGVNIAWARAGSGTPLIRASTWLTHLEFDWDSPVWRHWVRFLAGNFELIRYDERGCGMSDWRVDDVGFQRWFDDFDAVVDAAKPVKPFVILGMSQGGAAAINYAIRHPDHVSHLVLYGAYAQGWAKRDQSDDAERYKAITQLTRLGWGQDNPVYRQLFTSRFVPEASKEQLDWFNEVCRKTTTPEMAERLLKERGKVNILDMIDQVSVPTLVLHGTNDEVVPLSAGRLLATRIPGAHFVQLDTRNHILLEDEPAWSRFKEEVLAFTGVSNSESGENPVFATLTPREREILICVAEGCTNAEAGERLFISEKTVRNHITKIFEKLGVHSRAQAIVLAKDGNLQATPPSSSG